MTYIDGEVTGKTRDAKLDAWLVTIRVKMTNQDDSTLAIGDVDVELPG